MSDHVCFNCKHIEVPLGLSPCQNCNKDTNDLWEPRRQSKDVVAALRAENERLKERNAKLEKNNSVLLGIIRRLALNPDNAFALRAEADTLAELEGE